MPATKKRRCAYRHCGKRLRAPEYMQYCSRRCRYDATKTQPPSLLWMRCPYCGEGNVGYHGASCGSPPCRRSNSIWHTAYNSTDGRIDRVYAPDVSAKSGGRCAWCDLPLTPDAQFDHIVPRCVGGDHTLENLQLLHSACNRAKGNSWVQ